MFKEGYMIKDSKGNCVELNKYYINFLGKFIGIILASDKDKATAKANMYFTDKEIEIEEGREVVIDDFTRQYIVVMTELEYKEYTLPIEDILEDFTKKD
jgi:hypothetical protein